MNTNTKAAISLYVSTACALVIGSLLSGCATNGYDKSQAAAASLQIAAAEVQAENRALDLTLASLNDLVNKPPVDLKMQFQRFNSNLDELTAAMRRNDTAARRITETSSKYFQNWDKELVRMGYDTVRTRSEARKAEVSNQFDSVNRYYQETQAALHPLVDYMVDIRKALGTDLTFGGLESIRGLVATANTNATKVQSALAKLADGLSTSGTGMSSVAVQNAQQ